MARSGQRLTIPTRVFLGFVLVLSVFTAIAGAGYLQHKRVASTLELLQKGYIPLALTLGEARATQAVFNAVIERAVHETTPTLVPWIQAARRLRLNVVRKARMDAERIHTLRLPASHARNLGTIESTLRQTEETYLRLESKYDVLLSTKHAKFSTDLTEELQTLRMQEQRIERLLRSAWHRVQYPILTTQELASAQGAQWWTALWITSLVALVLGLIVAGWSHRMLAPLPRLEERAAAVARGDLAPRLETPREDEIGRLMVAFERMVEALRARDVSLRQAADARRTLQQMQERILARLRDAVVVMDGQNRLRSVNPAASSLGLTGASVGQFLEHTELGSSFVFLKEAVEQAKRTGQSNSLRDKASSREPAHRWDFEIIPFEFDEKGANERGVLLVAQDVTDEAHTKSKLIRSERLAAISRMAAHVAHEVRNPLSSIGLNLEMLEDELNSGSGESLSLMKAIRREVERLNQLTEEYLRMVGLPMPNFQMEDWAELVCSVVSFLSPEMKATHVHVDMNMEPHLPAVPLDEPQMRQALINLLRNGREAMPEGGRLVLEMTREGEGVGLRLRDEGPGVPRQERERIFELFYTTKERGTGLGLALAHQIVTAHGGRLRCIDSPGRGAIFEIWLPLQHADQNTPRISDVVPATNTDEESTAWVA